MNIQTAITINAPMEKVFSVFSDLASAAERIAGIKSIEVLEGSPQMQVGTKWKETRIMFGKEATEIMWVTSLTLDKEYVVEAESHGAHYTSTYSFQEKDGAVEVSMTFGSEPLTFAAKLMGLMFFLFAGATKKALYQDMEDLKKVCEA